MSSVFERLVGRPSSARGSPRDRGRGPVYLIVLEVALDLHISPLVAFGGSYGRLHTVSMRKRGWIARSCLPKPFFDVALDLLKRYSGIVWDPSRFAVLLRGGDVRRLRSPVGTPCPRLTPGNAWGYPANCKIPLSRSLFEHCVASYTADPLA